MKTKLYLHPMMVQIGDEVTAEESAPGYQEVEASRIMDLVVHSPELLNELREMLSKAYDSGYLYGTWDTLNDQHKVCRECKEGNNGG